MTPRILIIDDEAVDDALRRRLERTAKARGTAMVASQPQALGSLVDSTRSTIGKEAGRRRRTSR